MCVHYGCYEGQNPKPVAYNDVRAPEHDLRYGPSTWKVRLVYLQDDCSCLPSLNLTEVERSADYGRYPVTVSSSS